MRINSPIKLIAQYIQIITTTNPDPLMQWVRPGWLLNPQYINNPSNFYTHYKYVRGILGSLCEPQSLPQYSTLSHWIFLFLFLLLLVLLVHLACSKYLSTRELNEIVNRYEHTCDGLQGWDWGQFYHILGANITWNFILKNTWLREISYELKWIIGVRSESIIGVRSISFGHKLSIYEQLFQCNVS